MDNSPGGEQNSPHIPSERCLTKYSGFGDYYDCLVEQPRFCPFAFPFGSGHFCLHARRKEMSTARPTSG